MLARNLCENLKKMEASFKILFTVFGSYTNESLSMQPYQFQADLQ